MFVLSVKTPPVKSKAFPVDNRMAAQIIQFRRRTRPHNMLGEYVLNYIDIATNGEGARNGEELLLFMAEMMDEAPDYIELGAGG